MLKRGLMAAALLLSLAVPEVARAQESNDMFADRRTIAIGEYDFELTFGATIEATEAFVPGTTFRCSGAQMDHTVWWTTKIPGAPIAGGPARRVTITTQGTSFDTVLAIYQSTAFHSCNDDMHPGSEQSRVRLIVSPAYDEYPIQVGGCVNSPTCAGDTSGQLELEVIPTPPNDDRVEAIALSNHQPSPVVATAGGTTEPGELRSCTAGGRTSPYDATVWYSFNAPSTGTVAFEATGVDSVISVYRGGTRVGCADDPAPNVKRTGLAVATSPGLYHVQVGGYGVDEAQAGNLTLRADFADPDPDDDGARGLDDCDETTALRNRKLPEILNNTRDENCDGIPAYDRDGDGELARPAGRDCDDDDARRHHGARDIRGNGIDEDCDGNDDEWGVLRSRIKARYFEAFPNTEFRTLLVKRAVRRSRIAVLCKGDRCPFERRVIKVRSNRRKVKLNGLFRGHLVPPDVVLRVKITKREHTGVGREFRTHASSLPDDKDLCHNPDKKTW